MWMPREYLNKLGRLFENPGWERGGSLGCGRGCAVITKSRSDVRLLGGRSTAYQHVKSKTLFFVPVKKSIANLTLTSCGGFLSMVIRK